VVLLEEVPGPAGSLVDIVSESWDEAWAHGLWLATVGELRFVDPPERHRDVVPRSQLYLWAPYAPELTVEIVRSDGLLRFYNIWDSHDGYRTQSQRYTSGMVPEVLDDGWTRYRCDAISVEHRFDQLVFRLRVRPPISGNEDGAR
jgi:hypothetical protein